MLRLEKTLQAWETPEFELMFKQELQALDRQHLPLQAGLSRSSYVSDDPIRVILIDKTGSGDKIIIKAGIFYSGIIAGSCCADDPTPVDQQTEYCEIMIVLDRDSAEATITLSED